MSRLAPCLLLTVLMELLAGSFFGASPAAAQEERYGRIEETESTVSYFYFAQAGEPTIQVSVWGTIPQPGIYEVPRTTEPDRLLTMAGGAPAQARSEGQERIITIRLFREREGQREEIYQAPLEEMLRNTENYPDLQGGDVLVVETRVEDKIGWRDVLSVVSSFGSLILLGERLVSRL